MVTTPLNVELNEFSLDLANISDLPPRLLRTASTLRQLTNSTGVKLYLVDRIYNEIYFCPNTESLPVHRISWGISTTPVFLQLRQYADFNYN